jgi:hypothetical protein
MIRIFLVYDGFHTFSTTPTTCLDYNLSRDQFLTRWLHRLLKHQQLLAQCLASGASVTVML